MYLRKLFQFKFPAHFQAKLSAASVNQPHEFTAFVQATPQQYQSRFQIILDVRQPQACVQTNLLICERHSASANECLKQFPKEPSGNTFNQICVVYENAVV